MTRQLIVALTVSALLSACSRTASTSSSDADLQKRTERQMDDYDRQSKRADDQQAKVEQQNAKFDALLDKWEEQARRYDAILYAMEKQNRTER